MDVTLDSIRDIRLFQPKLGYRFSVDSLLLCDFVNLRKVQSIADLGSGSGIVGILLAKKYPDANITLFELQENLVRLSEKNIAQNDLVKRVKVFQSDIRVLPSLPEVPRDFDLVIANPPFRRLKSGRLNIGEEKAIARHEVKLKLYELIETVSHILKAKGRFFIIYHPLRLSELLDNLRNKELEPKRLRFIHSHTSSEAKMFLLEAVKKGNPGLKINKPLVIYEKNGDYTDELKAIYNPVSEI
jgi:tRNA1Val (adenine37-N6)-methyltransferase